MDWTEIMTAIIAAIGGGGLASLFMIKPSRHKAISEARSTENKEQADRIDLGNKYVTQMLDMLDKIQSSYDKNQEKSDEAFVKNQESIKLIHNKLDGLNDGLTDATSELRMMVKYLNGDYQNFKSRHRKDDNTKKVE